MAQLAEQPPNKFSTLVDRDGNAIRDRDLTAAISNLIQPNGVVTVRDAKFFFQTSFGGGMLDDLRDELVNVQWVGGSATRHDQPAVGEVTPQENADNGGRWAVDWESDSPNGVWIGRAIGELGEDSTVEEALKDASGDDSRLPAGSQTEQIITENGGSTIRLDDPTVQSHHAVLWVGQAGRMSMFHDLEDFRDMLIQNWGPIGPDVTISVLFGDGQNRPDGQPLPANWDAKPGTFEELQAALDSLVGVLDTDEQFLFYADGYGGLQTLGIAAATAAPVLGPFEELIWDIELLDAEREALEKDKENQARLTIQHSIVGIPTGTTILEFNDFPLGPLDLPSDPEIPPDPGLFAGTTIFSIDEIDLPWGRKNAVKIRNETDKEITIDKVEFSTGGINVQPRDESQPQDSDGQKCINTQNKGGAKVAKTRTNIIKSCVKSFVKDKVGSAAACIDDDEKGKMLKAETKNIEKSGKACPPGVDPDFAAAGATHQNAVMAEAPLQLIKRLLGDDIDGALTKEAVDATLAKCQSALISLAGKILADHIKRFNKCKKTALKDVIGTVAGDSAQALAGCGREDTNTDLAERLAKHLIKLDKALLKQCAGVDPADAFPALAVVAPQTVAEALLAEIAAMAEAVEQAADALFAVDTIGEPEAVQELTGELREDLLASVRQTTCGNGSLDLAAGEECEPAAPGVAGALCPFDLCSADCRCTRECGNGRTQAELGEECEEDNVCPSGNCIDPGLPNECTCESVCGDGAVSPELGEQCESDSHCPANDCIAPGQPGECTCAGGFEFCGNGIRENDEVCDGTDFGGPTPTHGLCSQDCTDPCAGAKYKFYGPPMGRANACYDACGFLFGIFPGIILFQVDNFDCRSDDGILVDFYDASELLYATEAVAGGEGLAQTSPAQNTSRFIIGDQCFMFFDSEGGSNHCIAPPCSPACVSTAPVCVRFDFDPDGSVFPTSLPAGCGF